MRAWLAGGVGCVRGHRIEPQHTAPSVTLDELSVIEGEAMAPAQERSSTPGPEGGETERVKMAALSPGAGRLLGKQAQKHKTRDVQKHKTRRRAKTLSCL